MCTLQALAARSPIAMPGFAAHWTDVKAAGDWIPWQFEHPDLIRRQRRRALHDRRVRGRQRLLRLPRLHLHDRARKPGAHGRLHRPDGVRHPLARPCSEDALRHVLPLHHLGSEVRLRLDARSTQAGPTRAPSLARSSLQADSHSLRAGSRRPEWQSADSAAYQRLIDTYKPFGFYGWAMGYGQGFVTQSALLLDRMNDATTMFDWTAKEIYDPALVLPRSSFPKAPSSTPPAALFIAPATKATACRRPRSSRPSASSSASTTSMPQHLQHLVAAHAVRLERARGRQIPRALFTRRQGGDSNAALPPRPLRAPR